MKVILHPENYKILKEVDFLIENNLPIPRDKLYIVMPELFEYDPDEIEEIEEKKKKENRILLGYVFLKR